MLLCYQQFWFLDLPELQSDRLRDAVPVVHLGLLTGGAAQETQERPPEPRLRAQVDDQVDGGVQDGQEVAAELLEHQGPGRGAAGTDPIKLQTLEDVEGDPGGVAGEEHGGDQQQDHLGYGEIRSRNIIRGSKDLYKGESNVHGQ